MKKLKPCVSKILFTVLCAVMLFGCGNKTSGKETGNLPGQGNVSGQDANGQKPSDGTDVGVQDGGVQGNGNFSDGEGKTQADGEAGTNVPDQSDGFLKDGTDDGKTSPKGDGQLPQATVVADKEQRFEILTNYKERSIPSVKEYGAVEGEYYCNVLLNAKNQIEYYTQQKSGDGRHFFKYTLVENETGSIWEREALLWCDSFGSEIGDGSEWVKVFAGEDGGDYAWYLGKDENAHLVKRVEDYSVEIMGLDWGYTNFIEPAVLANGQIVCADLGRECSIYDPADGSRIKRFPCGFYQSICVRGNQIYIGDKTGTYVQHYDAGRGEFAAELTAGFDVTIRTAVSGDDVYVCNMHGIYRADAFGGPFSKVLDAGTYHFASESADVLKFFVIGDAFYVVYGESGCPVKKYSPAGAHDVAEKYLNIYSLTTNDVVLDMIAEFQDMYPEVEIIYETGEGADGSVTAADRIRALNARILAGDGPDILLMDGLPVDSYLSKGILADLGTVLGEQKDELTENIISVYQKDGKIYMLPAYFSVPMVLTTEQGMGRFSTLRAFVEYSEEEGGVMRPSILYSNMFEMLYYNYPPEIFLKEGTVNRDGIWEFLESFKRICESEKAVESAKWPTTYLGGQGWDSIYAAGGMDFAFANLKGRYALGVYPNALKIRGGQLVPCGRRFFPNTLFAINALSQKQELAGNFLRFAFSYDMQERNVGGYPLHKKALDDCATWDFSDHVLSTGDLVLEYASAKENAEMIAYVRKVDQPFMADAIVYGIMEEEAMRYLTGKCGLEASVDAVASKVQLYLYEQ